MSISEQIVFKYIQEKAPVLCFTLAADGQILTANQYAKMITGIPIVHGPFQKLVIDFKDTFAWSDLVQDPTVEHLLNIKTGTGLPQSYFFTFTPFDDKILALGRLDAEELEKMRREVLTLNQELNNLTRRLHQNNAQLKRLNEEKNRFLGMAAHDLRKPIGLVLTYSEFLIDEAASLLTEEQVGFLNTIHSSSFFMKRLVDDFLDVSAIEAGRFDLNRQWVRIHDVLTHSLALNHLQARKKGVSLQVEEDEKIPLLNIDGPKIEQVIINLVSNAIEHTHPATEVVISLRAEPPAISFSVKDSGPGIPEEELARLFKPFEKTSVPKTSGEKSTGLGLVITRKIIEAHGGQIGVRSQVGKGTTLFFRIPIGQAIK
jgi:signal transduction histidine kinase